MDFGSFLALIATKFAEEAARSAGQEFGKRLGEALADAIFGNRLDEAEALQKLLTSISNIITQSLDQDNIRQAVQLIQSGNLQLKQLKASSKVSLGEPANKTFADAFGILESHPRTAIDVKTLCALSHTSLLLILADLEPAWKPILATTLEAYINSLKEDVTLIKNFEEELRSTPDVSSMSSGCKFIREGDIVSCNLYWTATWNVSSKARGQTNHSFQMYAGLDSGPILVSKEDFKKELGTKTQETDAAIIQRKEIRQSSIITPIEKSISNLNATLQGISPHTS